MTKETTTQREMNWHVRWLGGRHQAHHTLWIRCWIRTTREAGPHPVQFSRSVMSDSLWPHGLQHARPPCPSPTSGVCSNSVHWVDDAFQPSHPLLSPSSSTFNLSQHQGLFQWVSFSHQVARVLEFQLQHPFFQWIFRTDFFRMNCLGLLAVQGTLKSLFQHHSSKASILQCSGFFMVQLSHPYMTTGKSIALTRQTFVGKDSAF